MGWLKGIFTLLSVIKELISIGRQLFKFLSAEIDKSQRKKAAKRLEEAVKATVKQRPKGGAIKRTDVLEAQLSGTLDELKKRYTNDPEKPVT